MKNHNKKFPILNFPTLLLLATIFPLFFSQFATNAKPQFQNSKNLNLQNDQYRTEKIQRNLQYDGNTEPGLNEKQKEEEQNISLDYLGENVVEMMVEKWSEGKKFYQQSQQKLDVKRVNSQKYGKFSDKADENIQGGQIDDLNLKKQDQIDITNENNNNNQINQINENTKQNTENYIEIMPNFQNTLPYVNFGYSLQSFGATPPPIVQSQYITQKIIVQQSQFSDQQQQKQPEITLSQIENAVNLLFQSSYEKSQPFNQTLYFSKKYSTNKTSYSLQDQLPLCIVVPSYNNANPTESSPKSPSYPQSQSQPQPRYLLNIQSLLSQNYQNYKILFIDDGSTDQTFSKITSFKKQHNLADSKLKIIRNQVRKMGMENLYMAAHGFCSPWDVMIVVDGDDWLIGDGVFGFVNFVFQTQGVWLAYTNYIVSGSHVVGSSHQYPKFIREQNQYRNAAFVISHLRAFYTKLFRLVKQQDLKDQDSNWFRAGNDVAMYIPMAQMCHKKIKYFPQITYLYNAGTEYNNHYSKLQEQKRNQKLIRSRKPYLQLKELFTEEEKMQQKLNTRKKIN